MRQQEVFNKIGVILKELNDQYKYLEANPDDMNSLELELFVANAHFLADHAEILNKINLQLATTKPALPAPKEEPKTEEKYFEPVVRQHAKQQAAANEKTDQPPAINFEIFTPTEDKEPEIIRHELDIEEIPDWDEEPEPEILDEPLAEIDEVPAAEIVEEPVDEVVEEPVAEVVEEPVKEVKPVQVEPLPEYEEAKAPEVVTEAPQQVEATPLTPEKKNVPVKEEVLTINQRMSVQLNKGGVTDQPAGQPISDLKHAISLNDKLLYIKDLFNGYSLAYSEAIEILNRLSSFEDAERFLSKNYVAKNNWESKADTAAKFYAVLKRRYM